MERRVSIITLLCVFFLAHGSLLGAFTADKRDTLRGLTQLGVLLEFLPDDLEREGINRNQLKREIETRLMDAGVHVLTTAEVATLPGAPYIYVSIASLPTTNAYEYVLIFALKQLVHLARDPVTELFVTTWETSAAIRTNGGGHGLDIKSRLSGALERFLIDYRAVNRK